MKTNLTPTFRRAKKTILKQTSNDSSNQGIFRSSPNISSLVGVDEFQSSVEGLNPSTETTSISSKSTAKKAKLSAYELSQILLQEHTFAIIEDFLYFYDEKYGYFCLLSQSDFEKKARQITPINYRIYLNSLLLAETYKWIMADQTLVVKKDMLKNNEHYFNFKDRLINISNEQSFYHSPKLYCTNYINVNLSSNQSKGSCFKDFLNQVTNSSTNLKLLLQEVTGYALSNNRSLKKIGILLGPSNSGKSTYLNLLEHIIGSQFCSHISLHDINDRFRLSLMVNKRLNTCGEMSENGLKHLSTIKMLSGHDNVIVERKGCDPFSFQNKAFMLFSGNHLPSLDVKDHKNALLKRLLLIPFPVSIPPEEQDPDLLPKLFKESSYIALWALRGYLRLKSNNFTFTQGDETGALYKQFLNQDPHGIISFIDNCCALDERARISTSDLHECYLDFCLHQKIKPLSQSQFTQSIKRDYPWEHKKIRIGANTTYGFIGIRMRTNFDEYLTYDLDN